MDVVLVPETKVHQRPFKSPELWGILPVPQLNDLLTTSCSLRSAWYIEHHHTQSNTISFRQTQQPLLLSFGRTWPAYWCYSRWRRPPTQSHSWAARQPARAPRLRWAFSLLFMLHQVSPSRHFTSTLPLSPFSPSQKYQGRSPVSFSSPTERETKLGLISARSSTWSRMFRLSTPCSLFLPALSYLLDLTASLSLLRCPRRARRHRALPMSPPTSTSFTPAPGSRQRMWLPRRVPAVPHPRHPASASSPPA